MPTYKDKDGRWRFRFSYKKKRYGGTTPIGANLERVAAKMERELLDKLVGNRFTGVMPTVKQFIVQFLDYQRARVRPLTYKNERSNLTIHVEPHIGGLTLDAVTVADVDGLVTRWAKTAMASSINTRLAALGAMFTRAVEWKYIEHGPKIPVLKVPKRTPRFLSRDEATTLIAAAQPRFESRDYGWRAMIVVGIRTGMRIGELRGLQWTDVDFDGERVVVRRTDPGKRGFASNDPKGGKFRVLPLASDARAALLEHLEKSRARLGARWRPEMWVWPGTLVNDEGALRTLGGCQSAMKRIAGRAQLRKVTWHTLRHTFASWLVMDGVSLSAVQELLGHESIRMTEVYAHLAPSYARNAAIAVLSRQPFELGPGPDAPGDDLGPGAEGPADEKGST